MIERLLVNAVHDVSDGGWLVALAEMALAGSRGATLPGAWAYRDQYHSAGVFQENQGLYVVTTASKYVDELESYAHERGIFTHQLGSVTGRSVIFPADAVYEAIDVPLADLRAAHERFFGEWMEG